MSAMTVTKLGERLGLAAAALGFLREALIWPQRVALDGVVLAALLTVLAPALVVALVLAVTRRASWLAFAVLVLLTALAWFTTAKLGLTDGGMAFSVGAASLIVGTLALGFMAVALWQARERR